MPSEFRDHRCALCRRVMLSPESGCYCAACVGVMAEAHRAGQEAMRERALAIAREASGNEMAEYDSDTWTEAWQCACDHIRDAIRALEPEL